MKHKNYKLFVVRNRVQFVTTHEQIGFDVGDDIPQEISEYVNRRWTDEYQPLEAEFLIMERRDDPKAWRAMSRQLEDIELDIRKRINEM